MGLVCQAICIVIFYLSISSAVTKVGRLFVNQISAVALIREAALNRSFTVTSLFFGKKKKMKDFLLVPVLHVFMCIG